MPSLISLPVYTTSSCILSPQSLSILLPCCCLFQPPYVLSSFLWSTMHPLHLLWHSIMPLSSSFYFYPNKISTRSISLAKLCIRKANWLNQVTQGSSFLSQLMSLLGVCSFNLSGKKFGAGRFSLSHTNWHHFTRPGLWDKRKNLPWKGKHCSVFQISPALITFWDLSLENPGYSKRGKWGLLRLPFTNPKVGHSVIMKQNIWKCDSLRKF